MFFRSIAYRHIVRELVLVLCVVFVLLILVSLAARFTGYLQEAAAGKFAADVLWMLVALRLPEFVQLSLPFALVLAIVITFGRIHADQEYVVLVVGNASTGRILGWVLSVVIPASLLVGILSLVVTPLSRQAFVDLLEEAAVSHEFDVLKSGEFRTFNDGQRALTVGAVDRENRQLFDLFFYDSTSQVPSVILAESATLLVNPVKGHRILKLFDGVRYEGEPGTYAYQVAEFKSLSMRLDVEQEIDVPVEVEATLTNVLNRDDIEQSQELDWRVSLPLMTLVSGLMAFGLARTKPRAGRFGRIIPGILSFVGYYLILVFIQMGTPNSSLVSSVAIYLAHLVVAVLALFLIYRGARPS